MNESDGTLLAIENLLAALNGAIERPLYLDMSIGPFGHPQHEHHGWIRNLVNADYYTLCQNTASVLRSRLDELDTTNEIVVSPDRFGGWLLTYVGGALRREVDNVRWVIVCGGLPRRLAIQQALLGLFTARRITCLHHVTKSFETRKLMMIASSADEIRFSAKARNLNDPYDRYVLRVNDPQLPKGGYWICYQYDFAQMHVIWNLATINGTELVNFVAGPLKRPVRELTDEKGVKIPCVWESDGGIAYGVAAYSTWPDGWS